MKIHDAADCLPEEGKCVLAYMPDRPWFKGNPPDLEVKWKVVWLVKGISLLERKELEKKKDKRAKEIHFGDEYGNNLRDFRWEQFGLGDYFGQEVSRWCYLPTIE